MSRRSLYLHDLFSNASGTISSIGSTSPLGSVSPISTAISEPDRIISNTLASNTGAITKPISNVQTVATSPYTAPKLPSGSPTQATSPIAVSPIVTDSPPIVGISRPEPTAPTNVPVDTTIGGTTITTRSTGTTSITQPTGQTVIVTPTQTIPQNAPSGSLGAMLGGGSGGSSEKTIKKKDWLPIIAIGVGALIIFVKPFNK